jgi:hypothetical protein
VATLESSSTSRAGWVGVRLLRDSAGRFLRSESPPLFPGGSGEAEAVQSRLIETGSMPWGPKT